MPDYVEMLRLYEAGFSLRKIATIVGSRKDNRHQSGQNCRGEGT